MDVHIRPLTYGALIPTPGARFYRSGFQTCSIIVSGLSFATCSTYVEQCLTTALFTACADGGSESPPPLDFCKACLWQVMDASIDLRDPNLN